MQYRYEPLFCCEVYDKLAFLKYDHRMIRNYLKGIAGDQTKTLLAAAAYNMKKPICFDDLLQKYNILTRMFDQTYKI